MFDFLKPIKTIQWNRFFNIDGDEIVHFKIKPDKMVSNDTQILARAMHEFYTDPISRVSIDIKGIKATYHIKDKAYYDIVFEPGSAAFYLSVPRKWASFLRMKMDAVWPKCGIDVVPKSEIATFDPAKTAACDVRLQRSNLFSLKTDPRNQDPLNGLFVVLKDLAENDKVRISFCFDSRDRSDWQKKAEDDYKLYRSGKMPRRQQIKKEDAIHVAANAIDFGFEQYIAIRMMPIEALIAFAGGAEQTKEDRFLEAFEKRMSSPEIQKLKLEGGMSHDTIRKMKAPTFNTNIRILSQSDSEERRKVNLRTTANAFKDLSGDNELAMVELGEKATLRRIKQVENFKQTVRYEHDVLSDEEVAKMIIMPQVTLQKEYHLDTIDTREAELPESITTGRIPQGVTTYKGKEIKTYWPDNNLDYFAKPTVYEGEMGTGKTTDCVGTIIDKLAAGYWNMAIDVNDGQLVDDVVRFAPESIPKEKFKIFDFDDPETVFRLGLTELVGRGTSDRESERAMSAVADVLSHFLDTLNAEPLTDRMKRYFVSGVRMCLLNGYSGMADFRCILENHQFRCELIELSKGKIRDKVIEDMRTLNKVDGRNGSITGTREELIAGIIDRMDLLSRTDLLEDCFMFNPNPEIDFRKWADEGCFIGIKCNKSGKEEAVNTLVTFLVQKMWCAMLTRYDMKDDNGSYDKGQARMGFITLDEPHSFPAVCKILTGAIRESRKWRCGFTFAVHTLTDLGPLLPKLKAAGANFVLFKTDVDNYKSVEDIMGDYTIDDALETKQWHALHIISVDGKRYVYDAAVMPPPDKRFDPVDRSDVIDICRKQYGINYRELYYSAS